MRLCGFFYEIKPALPKLKEYVIGKRPVIRFKNSRRQGLQPLSGSS